MLTSISRMKNGQTLLHLSTKHINIDSKPNECTEHGETTLTVVIEAKCCEIIYIILNRAVLNLSSMSTDFSSISRWEDCKHGSPDSDGNLNWNTTLTQLNLGCTL